MHAQKNREREPAGRREEDPPENGDQQSLLAKFRERLVAGNYDAVIGRGLRKTLRGAAADTGLEAEIGALRLVLVRLLNEERDPSRLAAGVSRVAGVAIQAARLRHNPDADLGEIRTLLVRELDAVEREHSRNSTREKETRRNDAC